MVSPPMITPSKVKLTRLTSLRGCPNSAVSSTAPMLAPSAPAPMISFGIPYGSVQASASLVQPAAASR